MLLNEKAYDFIQAFDINGIHTEFVAHKFVNKILIIITQFGKIANFYSVKNQVFNEVDRNTKVFDIQQKFGGPSIEIEGAVRYLMNFIGNNPEEILICLALKNPDGLSKTTLDEVKEVLLKIPIFAQ